jgi:hypothetical protein
VACALNYPGAMTRRYSVLLAAFSIFCVPAFAEDPQPEQTIKLHGSVGGVAHQAEGAASPGGTAEFKAGFQAQQNSREDVTDRVNIDRVKVNVELGVQPPHGNVDGGLMSGQFAARYENAKTLNLSGNRHLETKGYVGLDLNKDSILGNNGKFVAQAGIGQRTQRRVGTGMKTGENGFEVGVEAGVMNLHDTVRPALNFTVRADRDFCARVSSNENHLLCLDLDGGFVAGTQLGLDMTVGGSYRARISAAQDQYPSYVYVAPHVAGKLLTDSLNTDKTASDVQGGLAVGIAAY